ncbi:hypothetical protein [Desulfonema magnum]|uniref:SpoVT-AbrB domain-containing protein n=1 Tax=Desulfonema magnum TaxID=45655 RepID=A0A975GQN2_9BACT|nr:hypothetical protein [Desulfonema magnum]QTA90042.1 Uncharacterized protein dnm_061020 [Desulfonema magnum]
MTQQIELSLDVQGRILIPPEIQRRLGLLPGMTLIVEKGEDKDVRLCIQPQKTILVEKNGVLMARGKPLTDLTNITQDERDHHKSERLERVNL